MSYVTVFLQLLLLLTTPDPDPASVTSLTIRLHNVEVARGTLYVAAYDNEEAFKAGEDYVWRTGVRADKCGTIEVRCTDLKPGRYALAAYHDEDDDDKLKKNLFGIPTEAYGFSNNPRAKWSAPGFEEIIIEIGPRPMTIDITLQKWKNR